MGETCPAQRRAERCRCIIIGGGPAGLTCATYFARFNCHTTVIYRDDQRARLIERTWNVPGYPEGIRGDELIARCREQALSYGVEMLHGEATQVTGEAGRFRAHLADGREVYGGQVVFATGVEDVPPNIPRVEKYVGRGLRHCPICDGYEANDSRLAIIGVGDKVARHALFLTAFTERITVLLNGEGRLAEIDASLRRDLSRHGIPVHESRVADVLDEGAEIRGFVLEDGTRVDVDRAYSATDVRPRSEVAHRLGVRLDQQGFIRVDQHGCTNIAGVYAVGDVVNRDYAQIVIAMGQAATAAIHIHARHISEG